MHENILSSSRKCVGVLLKGPAWFSLESGLNLTSWYNCGSGVSLHNLHDGPIKMGHLAVASE